MNVQVQGTIQSEWDEVMRERIEEQFRRQQSDYERTMRQQYMDMFRAAPPPLRLGGYPAWDGTFTTAAPRESGTYSALVNYFETFQPMMQSARAVAREKTAPETKAEELLEQTLPAEDYGSLAVKGYIEVVGKHWTYRIVRHGQTELWDKAKMRATACLVLSDAAAPDQDRMVAVYILLKNDEDGFLKTSNITRTGGGSWLMGLGLESR